MAERRKIIVRTCQIRITGLPSLFRVQKFGLQKKTEEKNKRCSYIYKLIIVLCRPFYYVDENEYTILQIRNGISLSLYFLGISIISESCFSSTVVHESTNRYVYMQIISLLQDEISNSFISHPAPLGFANCHPKRKGKSTDSHLSKLCKKVNFKDLVR